MQMPLDNNYTLIKSNHGRAGGSNRFLDTRLLDTRRYETEQQGNLLGSADDGSEDGFLFDNSITSCQIVEVSRTPPGFTSTAAPEPDQQHDLQQQQGQEEGLDEIAAVQAAAAASTPTTIPAAIPTSTPDPATTAASHILALNTTITTPASATITIPTAASAASPSMDLTDLAGAAATETAAETVDEAAAEARGSRKRKLSAAEAASDKRSKLDERADESTHRCARIIGQAAADVVIEACGGSAPERSRAQISSDLADVCSKNSRLIEEVVEALTNQIPTSGAGAGTDGNEGRGASGEGLNNPTRDQYMKTFVTDERQKDRANGAGASEERAGGEKERAGGGGGEKGERGPRSGEDHDQFYRESTKHDIGNNVVNMVVDLFVNLDKMTASERATYRLIASAVNSVLKLAFEQYWTFMSRPENLADKMSILKTLTCLIYTNFGEYAREIFDPSVGASGPGKARCYVLVVIVFWIIGRSIHAFRLSQDRPADASFDSETHEGPYAAQQPPQQQQQQRRNSSSQQSSRRSDAEPPMPPMPPQMFSPRPSEIYHLPTPPPTNMYQHFQPQPHFQRPLQPPQPLFQPQPPLQFQPHPPFPQTATTAKPLNFTVPPPHHQRY
ncbi:MAG: hypothetical protein E6Q06_01920 [Candidatus Moraniibacteriota bacterium]|nr:MAG: hypothetical protein E6Q06_01920 [Candidatus Moranbacteria bacterium]